MNFETIVKGRKSVRTFEEKTLASGDIEKLNAFISEISNPYGLDIKFKFLDGKKDKLSCPVVVGTNFYIGAKMKLHPNLNEAFGYSFEALVLYAQSLGIGTVWVGGTMDRDAFEKAMDLSENEVMPCMSPLGYPADKMSMRESMMRKGIKADSRMNFENMFFKDSFDSPLKYEDAGNFAFPLEMVRYAPSAVNKQPWRVIVTDSTAHFYLKRSKGFVAGTVDMQKIDIGIAMCHFDLAAKEIGFTTEFIVCDPKLASDNDVEYIASYKLI